MGIPGTRHQSGPLAVQPRGAFLPTKGRRMRSIVAHGRFLGCLLGQAVGDALGAPYEGLTDQDIYFTFGPTRALVERPRAERLFYTDDTQMTIGVAEALIDDGEIVEASLCR